MKPSAYLVCIASLVQAVVIVLSLYLLYRKQLLGLFVLIPAILADLCLSKKNALANVVKIVLLFQGVCIVVFTQYNLPFKSIGGSSEKGKSDVVIAPKNTKVYSNLPQKTNILKTISRSFTRAESKQQFVYKSKGIIEEVFGGQVLPASSSDDLRYRDSKEVRDRFQRVFEELPPAGFDNALKNPCWLSSKHDASSSERLVCLPYAYLLGMPKCGTSDLFERLKHHPQVRMPRRKEVRWFTRGEFMTSPMEAEDGDYHPHREEVRLGPGSSIFSFTNAFDTLAKEVMDSSAQDLITIDGGPHTLWWPTQNADGSRSPEDIPPPQVIRELQPNAKFIITLTDPVHRMYSDYYFLGDNLMPVRPGGGNTKSPEEFHERAARQVQHMTACVESELAAMPGGGGSAAGSPLWFRASQMCAHDRHALAVGGWGRLSIGLYGLYLEKWLEHFSEDQFLVTRIEDYETDRKEYMSRVLRFLGLHAAELEEEEWAAILYHSHANENQRSKDPMLPETEVLLRGFYQPYNDMLVKFLKAQGARDHDSYLWSENTEAQRHARSARAHAGEEEGRSSEALLEMHRRRKEEVIHQRTRDVASRDRPGSHNRGGVPNPHDQHGVLRHLGEGRDNPLLPRRDTLPGGMEKSPVRGAGGDHSLRGAAERDSDADAKDLLFRSSLKPRAFPLDGLYRNGSREFGELISPILERDKPLLTEAGAAYKLCLAAFSLDFSALEYLLVDVGVSANVSTKSDNFKTALHCLALLHVMADGHPRSELYTVLKGKTSWLSHHFNPPLGYQHSVLARDIIDGLDKPICEVARWLLRAGVHVDAKDTMSYSALHFAAVGGMLGLSKLLLENGADPDIINNEKRTPLHYAAANGHTELASILIRYGADVQREDIFGATPIDIISNPGPVLPEDAERYLKITQRPVRRIERTIHPELHPAREDGWLGGRGEWGEERLKGYEDDMECEIDQYYAHEITADEIYTKYFLRQSPVLIRGLFSNWTAIEKYVSSRLVREHGELKVQVSDIPYAIKYGGGGYTDMTLAEYIAEMHAHKVIGDAHPWYVFRGHPVPQGTEAADSLVRYEDCPTPPIIQAAFERVNPPGMRGREGKKAREIFVNAQWALGSEGTGAPVHFHNTAWNALVYGAKKWVIYPPHYMIMSNRQILEFFETDLNTFKARGVRPHTCVQTAGDLMIIPESWGHGVLNIQEAIAVATESKVALWRMRPGLEMIARLPNEQAREKREKKESDNKNEKDFYRKMKAARVAKI